MRLLIKVIGSLLLLCCFSQTHAQNEKTWDLFKDATFRDVYLEEFGGFAAVLNDDKNVAGLDGQTITIKGYHIPVMEESLIILSKYNNANCFFCGNAGQESILEVRMLYPAPRRFEMDEKLTFTGVLKVNTTDWEVVSFILEDAVLVE